MDLQLPGAGTGAGARRRGVQSPVPDDGTAAMPAAAAFPDPIPHRLRPDMAPTASPIRRTPAPPPSRYAARRIRFTPPRPAAHAPV
jgi:hypothetical protein